MYRAKRSTLNSRAQVDLIGQFKFLYSTNSWSGIQVITANMETVGKFEMALALSKHELFSAIYKHYYIEK